MSRLCGRTHERFLREIGCELPSVDRRSGLERRIMKQRTLDMYECPGLERRAVADVLRKYIPRCRGGEAEPEALPGDLISVKHVEQRGG